MIKVFISTFYTSILPPPSVIHTTCISIRGIKMFYLKFKVADLFGRFLVRNSAGKLRCSSKLYSGASRFDSRRVNLLFS
jgi:hypothetical protein